MIEILRTYSQQLSHHRNQSPHDIVEWMGAVQAQDITMSKWAVGVRQQQPALSLIDEELKSGKIIRMHILRPTWHMVSAQDVRWMLMLTGKRLRPTYLSWGKQFDISEQVYGRSCEIIARMLAGNRHMAKQEITERLTGEGMQFDVDQVNYMLNLAEADGLICNGEEKDRKHTYALLDERVPHTPIPPREEALALLAHKYFRSHSPATLEDFTWWSGLTTTEAKQAVQSIEKELECLNMDGQKLYCHHLCPTDITDVNAVHLLPPYDEFLISYKTRTHSLPTEHNRKAFTPYGIFFPVLFQNGKIIGNWKKTSKKGAIDIETSLFNPKTKVNKKQLKEAVERYKSFMKN